MPETFISALEYFLKSKKVAVRPTTYAQYQYLTEQIRRGAVLVHLDQTPLPDVTLEALQALLAILDDPVYFPAVGETTVKKMLKFLKAALTWSTRRGWITANPALDLEFRRVHVNETQPFQTVELLAILSVQPTTPAGQRDLAMWFLLADTGIRCHELCQLRLADLNGNELVIRSGKGGKRRSVSLGSAAAQVIHSYLSSYRPAGEPFLFLTEVGTGMTTRHVAKRLEIWAHKAGVANATPHRFRATFATQFVLKEGHDLLKLQALLGHTTLDMSRRYVKLAMEEEARLSNSACSVVDQLLRKELDRADEASQSPPYASPVSLTNCILPMGSPTNLPDPALWMGMFQVFAGVVHSLLQTQPGAGQPSTISIGNPGSAKLLPLQNRSAREG